MKFGIYWQKSKEDRFVYSFLVKIEQYYECQLFLRATCQGNKLNLLNSTWKMVKVDRWSSLCWSSIPPSPSPQINSSVSFVTLDVPFVQNHVISVPPTFRAEHGLAASFYEKVYIVNSCRCIKTYFQCVTHMIWISYRERSKTIYGNRKARTWIEPHEELFRAATRNRCIRIWCRTVRYHSVWQTFLSGISPWCPISVHVEFKWPRILRSK